MYNGQPTKNKSKNDIGWMEFEFIFFNEVAAADFVDYVQRFQFKLIPNSPGDSWITIK